MSPFGVNISGTKEEVIARLSETSEKYPQAKGILSAFADHVQGLPKDAIITGYLHLMCNYSVLEKSGLREVGI